MDTVAKQIETLEFARRYLRAGISVCPVKTDGSKSPRGPWKALQLTHLEADEVERTFGRNGTSGVAVIMGRVSGDLEAIDVDDGSIVDEFESAVAKLSPGLIERLTKIKTPRDGGGWQYWYRCPGHIEGNQKLAWSEPRPQHNDDGTPLLDPNTRTHVFKPEVMVETRGEAGYCVAVGSPSACHPTGREYQHVSGPPPWEPPTITPAERMALFAAARSLCRRVGNIELDQVDPHSSTADPGLRPGDLFNQRASWTEILEPHGWKEVGREGDLTLWKRPGKTTSTSSAKSGLKSKRGNDLFCVHSTNAHPFKPYDDSKTTYNKFAAYVLLNHGGDYIEATKAVVAMGYDPGSQPDGPMRGPDTGSGQAPNGVNAHTASATSEAINLTDLGNGERFIRDHRDDVRYCHPWKRWLCWDGLRWKMDEDEHARRLAKQTVRSIANEIALEDEKAKRTAIFAWSMRSESVERVTALLKSAKSEVGIPVSVDDLDRKPWLFNCANGTLDLRTGQIHPPLQDDLLTTASPTTYPTGEVDCPLWFGFLNRIFGGSDELIDYIQQLLGLSLVGKVHEHILPILWGGGANGKSVLIETWLRTLGPDYAMKAPLDLLMASRNATHPTDLADLYGKRFVACVESGQGRRLDEARVKELSGGDRIRARRMRQDFFEFTPTHTAFMVTNHRPVVKGTDDGIWRRLRMVPFEVTIPTAEQDKQLVDKLETEAGHILMWAVQGLRRWHECGLQEPTEVRAATGSYRDSQDILKDFLAERCSHGNDERVNSTDLYKSYQDWCSRNGEQGISQTVFGESMLERGYKRKTIRGRKYYAGLALKVEFVDGSKMW